MDKNLWAYNRAKKLAITLWLGKIDISKSQTKRSLAAPKNWHYYWKNSSWSDFQKWDVSILKIYIFSQIEAPLHPPPSLEFIHNLELWITRWFGLNSSPDILLHYDIFNVTLGL